MENLTQNELVVLESLNEISSSISQRELARRTGLSVGLINAVIKKLVRTGYVKTTQLNQRTISYLLTPEGFSQTALRSYKYVLETVRSYKTIKQKFCEIVDGLASEGFSEFYLNGDGELADLAESLFAERGAFFQRGLPLSVGRSSVIINAVSEPVMLRGVRIVNLVSELAPFHFTRQSNEL